VDTRALPLSPPELLARSTILLCEADGALQAACQLMLEGTQRLLIVPTISMTCDLLQEVQPDLLLIDVDGQSDVLPFLKA